MEIKAQSISLVVPGGCINNCYFCVSQMDNRKQKYIPTFQNQTEKENEYKKRLTFARNNSFGSLILTGQGEPVLNKGFLQWFSNINRSLINPFEWIELQTSGLTLEKNYIKELKEDIGISTISLSLSDIFSSESNAQYQRTPSKYKTNITKLCKEIKESGLNLRLSLNMTDKYNKNKAQEIFEQAKLLGADQLTFRLLYKSNTDCEQNIWIEGHTPNSQILDDIKNYIIQNGKILGILPFGATKYSVDGISTIIDSDSMSSNISNSYKYLILRPNGKLYTHWNDPGSLLF